MGEDIRYVLRDIADIKLLGSTGEYIIYYLNGRKNELRPNVFFDKSKFPLKTIVVIEEKKIFETQITLKVA